MLCLLLGCRRNTASAQFLGSARHQAEHMAVVPGIQAGPAAGLSTAQQREQAGSVTLPTSGPQLCTHLSSRAWGHALKASSRTSSALSQLVPPVATSNSRQNTRGCREGRGKRALVCCTLNLQCNKAAAYVYMLEGEGQGGPVHPVEVATCCYPAHVLAWAQSKGARLAMLSSPCCRVAHSSSLNCSMSACCERGGRREAQLQEFGLLGSRNSSVDP